MRERRKVGRRTLQTLQTSLDVGQEDRGFLKKAGIQQEWEKIFEKLLQGQKNGNDCKLEMHFYDIVYQHEYSA